MTRQQRQAFEATLSRIHRFYFLVAAVSASGLIYAFASGTSDFMLVQAILTLLFSWLGVTHLQRRMATLELIENFEEEHATEH